MLNQFLVGVSHRAARLPMLQDVFALLANRGLRIEGGLGFISALSLTCLSYVALFSPAQAVAMFWAADQAIQPDHSSSYGLAVTCPAHIPRVEGAPGLRLGDLAQLAAQGIVCIIRVARG